MEMGWTSGNGGKPQLWPFPALRLEMISRPALEMRNSAISNVQHFHPLRGTGLLDVAAGPGRRGGNGKAAACRFAAARHAAEEETAAESLAGLRQRDGSDGWRARHLPSLERFQELQPKDGVSSRIGAAQPAADYRRCHDSMVVAVDSTQPPGSNGKAPASASVRRVVGGPEPACSAMGQVAVISNRPRRLLCLGRWFDVSQNEAEIRSLEHGRCKKLNGFRASPVRAMEPDSFSEKNFQR